MAPSMSIEQIAGLLGTIVAPQKGERLLFLTDYPQGNILDAKRQARQEIVSRWYKAAYILAQQKGFRLLPIAKYPDTGRHNSDLPQRAVTHDGGHISDLAELVSTTNIVIAMNEYSATAPLKNIAAKANSLRVISMPGITADMEPAMSADYSRIAERGRKLLAVLQNASGFELTFSGQDIPMGTKLYIDTRASNWILDSGMCHQPGDFINFPSGELFTPPYEGISEQGRARYGNSHTKGVWPVYSYQDSRVAFLKVDKNRIVKVQGDCEEAEKIIEDIAKDENAANIAELAFGLNDKARSNEHVPLLEREKSGPHIAYGRNDHFGTPNTFAGKVKASVHKDYVYAKDAHITATIHAIYPNQRKILIAEQGKLVAV